MKPRTWTVVHSLGRTRTIAGSLGIKPAVFVLQPENHQDKCEKKSRYMIRKAFFGLVLLDFNSQCS